jgi:hypothetical protein
MDAQTQGPVLSLEGSNQISDGQLMKLGHHDLEGWSGQQDLEGSGGSRAWEVARGSGWF